MISIEGKYGIRATILAHSVSPDGIEMLTYELEYPRLILAELNTHRDKSRNSASSRAIPFQKMLEQLTARPVRFGQANPGMQDKGVDYEARIELPGVEANSRAGGPVYAAAEEVWEEAKGAAIEFSGAFAAAGYHKQVYNRLLEPFQMMKTVMSGTEWNNFFWLRDDDAADPTIRELARVMLEAKEASKPITLYAGQWHLPYVETEYVGGAVGRVYFIRDEAGARVMLTKSEAIIVSCARSAAVSFRNVDYGLAKCKEVYERLVGDERKHASALEHQATPMAPMDDGDNWVNIPTDPRTWQHGVSHMDRKCRLWSGNLRGWVQFRKTIRGENIEG